MSNGNGNPYCPYFDDDEPNYDCIRLAMRPLTPLPPFGSQAAGDGEVLGGMNYYTGSSSDNTRSPHSYRTLQPAIMSNDAAAYDGPDTPAPDYSAASSPAESPAESPEGSAFGVAGSDARRSSTSRHLVPKAPRLSFDAATLPATTNRDGSRQPGGGPASKQHTVPPRPKPGRKPATEEPESRRKAQNRASQRNFRERKQKNVQNLLETVNKMRQEQIDEKSAHLRTVQALEERMRYLEKTVCDWRESNRILEERLKIYEQGGTLDTQGHSLSSQSGPHQEDDDFRPMIRSARHDQPLQSMQSGCNRCTPERCACLADLTHDLQFSGEAMSGVLHDGHEGLDGQKHPHVEFEVDFTEKFRTKHHPVAFASSMEEPKITDCGFCKGQKDICICDPPT